jgi:ADP-ribosylglycohydrolase
MNQNLDDTTLCKASLLAGALGDSMGADVEFNGLELIRRKHPTGIASLAKKMAPENWFTDDTQMTLFTAEGLISSNIERALSGRSLINKFMHHAMLRWYATQGGISKIKTDLTKGIVHGNALWFLASPGLTCMGSLRELRVLGQPAYNDSKGCGTIMRIAPLAFGLPRDDIREAAISTSALTHGHVLGQFAAAVWAELIADVASGLPLEESARTLSELYNTFSMEGAEISRCMNAALDAPRDAQPETVESLGKGWIAEEALSIALYACLATKNLDDGLQCAIIHSGDSDSTGAIAGNLLGVMYPDDVFSHPLLSELGGRDIIAQLAIDLVASQSWSLEEATYRRDSYPHNSIGINGHG